MHCVVYQPDPNRYDNPVDRQNRKGGKFPPLNKNSQALRNSLEQAI